MVTALTKAPPATHAATAEKRRWQAELCLELQGKQLNQTEKKTILTRQRHLGPLRIQRAFYPEDDTCHLYLLHPPGGLVEGDQLTIQGTLCNNAHAVITTPSAGKCYRSLNKDNPQKQTVRFDISGNSTLEWLPQENIFFKESHSLINTEFHLDETSQLLGWDIACLGRPASNELFNSGEIDQTLTIIRNKTPQLIERNRIDGTRPIMHARYGLQGYTVSGLFFCTVGTEFDIKKIKQTWSGTAHPPRNALCSITLMDGILVARYLGHASEENRSLFTELWRLTRPKWIGKPVSIPRIWNT